MCEFNRALNVLYLRGFVTTNQQQQQPITPLRVVDAIAGTNVDLEFGHTARQVPMIAGLP